MASKDPMHVDKNAYKYALKQACESVEYDAIGRATTARLKSRVPKRTGNFASSIKMKKAKGHWASDIYIGSAHPLAIPIENGHKTRGGGWVNGSHTFHDFVARGGK